MTDTSSIQWNQRRHGSHAGRGFHYQHAVAAYIAISGWADELEALSIVPEGHEDISIQTSAGWIHAQAKSRRSHRGNFQFSEVITFLVDLWTAHEQRSSANENNAKLALILEKPPRNLPNTGWHQSIEDETDLASALQSGLLTRLGTPDRVDQLRACSSIITIADPHETALEVLSRHLDLPRAACTLHFHLVQARCQDAADANGVNPATNPATVTRADVQRILNEATELVDLASLEQAVRDGICEVADFHTPLHDDHFFSGVDVVPGHIVAGLPIERPEIERQIINDLESHRTVLIVGPSGAGKSALAWMSAYATRHLIRWYRIRRLRTEDVNSLLRTVRAARPSARSPIGLVADDLGQGERQGWDTLVADTAHMPGVYLLGIAREEDLALVQSAPACKQVHPQLDESLAEHLWNELRSNGPTRWQGWREPYELSEGLLLEYGYILTTGERLGTTIVRQVARRLSESRDLELRVLRLVAAADVWGAQVDVNALRKLLADQSEEDLQRCLTRLLDEHLVRESAPGIYKGLHQIRSRYLLDETHRLGIPLLTETISSAISILEGDGLQPFIAGVLLDGVLDDSEILSALSTRLKAEPDAEILIAALQALRLVGFFRLAQTWKSILDEEGVPPSKQIITARFALAEVRNEHFLPSIQAAIARMDGAMQADPRSALMNALDERTIQEIVRDLSDINAADRLFATLIGTSLNQKLMISLAQVNVPLADLDTNDLSSLLGTTRVFDREIAITLAARAGSPEFLLARVEAARPWTRNVRLSIDDKGQHVVEGAVLVVSDRQGDVHQDVVDLCRLLLNCIPHADIAACRAIDAAGDLAGYGDFQIADKHLTRKVVPSPAEVAWNRARNQAVSNVLASPTQTERLTAVSDLLARAAKATQNAADYWCRGQKLPLGVARGLLDIERTLSLLPPAPVSSALQLGPGDLGDYEFSDPVDSLISGVVNAVGRLYDPNVSRAALAAFIHDTLLRESKKLDETRWHLLPEPPIAAIQSLEKTLSDLFALVSQLQYEGDIAYTRNVAAARRTRSTSAIQRCADLARRSAHERLQRQITSLIDRLHEQALSVHVFLRQPKESRGNLFPPDELLILIEVPTVIDWSVAQKQVTAVIHELLEPVRTVVIAPIRAGWVIDSLAGKVQSQFFNLPNLLADWEAHIPFELFTEEAAHHFLTAVKALVDISTILGVTPRTPIHEIEEAAIIDASESYLVSTNSLLSQQEQDNSGLIEEALMYLADLATQVRTQTNAHQAGLSTSPDVAIAFCAPAKGRSNALTEQANGFHLSLLELDIDPVNIQTRIDLAITRLTNQDGE